jgi:hypothetical protein
MKISRIPAEFIDRGVGTADNQPLANYALNDGSRTSVRIHSMGPLAQQYFAKHLVNQALNGKKTGDDFDETELISIGMDSRRGGDGFDRGILRESECSQ